MFDSYSHKSESSVAAVTQIIEKTERERSIGGRQNTKWSVEIAGKCKHKWQPIHLETNEVGMVDLNEARAYLICMKCCAYTYKVVAWVGYYLDSPDHLENEEEV